MGSVSGFAVPGAAIVQLQSAKHQEVYLEWLKFLLSVSDHKMLQ